MSDWVTRSAHTGEVYEERALDDNGAVLIRFPDGIVLYGREARGSSAPIETRSAPWRLGVKPAASRSRAVAARSSARPSASLPHRSFETTTRQDTPSRVTVRVTADAMVQLSRTDFDIGLEIGGPVFGTWDEACDELTIREIAPQFERGWSNRITLDLDFAERLDQNHRAATGWTCCGDWHTHPSGHLEPSGADVRAWGAWADVFHRPETPIFAGLVVDGSPGHASPAVTAWVIEAIDGSPVARPATVIPAADWWRSL
jgi:hypothetical protein